MSYLDTPPIPGIEAYNYDLDPHPANRLEQYRFNDSAWFAAQQLDVIGFSYVSLQPGDGTDYQIAIIRPPTIEQWQRWERGRYLDAGHPAYARQPEFNHQNRYFVAHSIRGPLYGWGGQPLHWDYVWEKWTSRNDGTDTWTARVIGRFLTTLAHQITLRSEGATE